jgi:hypothetical protein
MHTYFSYLCSYSFSVQAYKYVARIYNVLGVASIGHLVFSATLVTNFTNGIAWWTNLHLVSDWESNCCRRQEGAGVGPLHQKNWILVHFRSKILIPLALDPGNSCLFDVGYPISVVGH